MTGRGEPPEGTPEGLPSGGEDEYRSVVFDESFVRAARLQEFSAQERMGQHARAVRSRSAFSLRSGPKQAALLVVLLLIAFGTAIYMGVRHPYQAPETAKAEPARMTVIPLAPQQTVQGGSAADLFARSPAAQFRIGAEGVNLPAVRRTDHFADSQVTTALTTAKDYIVESSLDPDVLIGGVVRPVRMLLDPDQFDQFDQSFASPSDDGRHAATGWLVRFDPSKVTLADKVRVQGTLSYTDVGAGELEVVADHTFTYALQPAGAGTGSATGVSLFTVRRELHFRFDQEDLRQHRAELQIAYVQAGPQACSADAAAVLRPLLAGQQATAQGPAGTDPYATGQATASLCGTLSPSSQPSPAPRHS
ncbi:SCO2583 family membrane protein [Streptomyces sp. NBC_01465]|uniref:SCO2583 family membrane protein n=1 Tax=Streptomyces sp. NBC_01465 TaxID=2903878 RepID=UPI002E357A60|nr:hypothetical protein [Streptomyces sp. NBC_01465]